MKITSMGITKSALKELETNSFLFQNSIVFGCLITYLLVKNNLLAILIVKLYVLGPKRAKIRTTWHPTIVGLIPYHCWSHTLHLLVSYPTIVGLIPYNCWWTLLLLVSYPTFVGLIPYNCWSHTLLLLVSYPTIVGLILYNCWSHTLQMLVHPTIVGLLPYYCWSHTLQ